MTSRSISTIEANPGYIGLTGQALERSGVPKPVLVAGRLQQRHVLAGHQLGCARPECVGATR